MILKNDPKQILFIPGEIGSRYNCFDRIEPFSKHEGNPVLSADKPWEGGVHWPSFLYSPKDKLFKIWYETIDHNIGKMTKDGTGRFKSFICYAYSEDGVNWIKPPVERFYKEQYPGNNIVMEDSGWLGGVASIIEDLDDPDHSRRYKMLIYDNEGNSEYHKLKGTEGARTAVSSDGIDWRFIGRFPVLPSQDTPSLWFDRNRRRYVAFLKSRFDNLRARMISYSDDFENWSEPALCLIPDPGDPKTLNFYGQSAFHHFGSDLGLLSCYDASTQLAYIELISAPQGIDWRRLPTKPRVLSPGDPGSWDSGGVYPGIGEPLSDGEKCWIYYTGESKRHDGSPTRHDKKSCISPAGVGIASFAPGRLVGQQFEGDGWFRSKPVLCCGGELTLDGIAKNPVKAGICSAGYGGQISGYTIEDCIPVEGDSGSHKIKWKTRSDLNDLRGRYVEIIIYGTKSMVYGACFSGDNKDWTK